MVIIDSHAMEKNAVEVNGYRQLFGYNIFQNIYFFLTEERNSYVFGSTWGWENDDRIYFLFKCLDKAWTY